MTHIIRRRYPFNRISHAVKLLGGLSIAQLIIFLLGLLSSILLTRYFSTEIYGQYQLVLSFFAIAGTLSLPGLGESLSISAAKGYDGNLHVIVMLKTGASLAASLGLIIFAWTYGFQDNIITQGVVCVAALFPFIQLSTLRQPWLNGKGWFRWLISTNIMVPSVQIVILLLLIWFHRKNLIDLLMWRQGAIALLSAFFILLFFKQRTSSLKDWETIKYGFKVSAVALLGCLPQFDKFIISKYLSITEVAIYSVAMIFPSQVKVLYTIFNQVFLPNIAGASDVREAWKYLRRNFINLYLFFILTGILGFLLLPCLVPLLFSTKYIESVPYGKWLWLTLCLTAPISYLGNILTLQKKINFVYITNVSHKVLVLVFYLIFIRYWGLWGMIYARIAINIFTPILYIYFFKYYLNKKTHFYERV